MAGLKAGHFFGLFWMIWSVFWSAFACAALVPALLFIRHFSGGAGGRWRQADFAAQHGRFTTPQRGQYTTIRQRLGIGRCRLAIARMTS
jgi:hypothetical protein